MGPCPRCHTALTQQTGKPPGRDVDVTVDVCGACQGMWIDGAELSLTSQALASLPQRLPGIVATARADAPGLACPRCKATLVELAVVGVPVDLCGECCGVWLDGGEFQRIASGHAPATRPPRVDTILCRTCRAPTPLAETFYTDEGLVCRACNEHVTPEEMRARAIASGAAAAYQGAEMRHAELQRPPVEDEVRRLRREVDALRVAGQHGSTGH